MGDFVHCGVSMQEMLLIVRVKEKCLMVFAEEGEIGREWFRSYKD
jgi:hypothetical protein